MAAGMKIMSSYPTERSKIIPDKKTEKVIVKPVQVMLNFYLLLVSTII